jgi:hypothetical protein
MSGSVRRLIVAAALALPPVLATCSKNAEAPKIPSMLVQPLVGDQRGGLAGYAVNLRPAVRVTDSTGHTIPGASVTFAVTGGGGSGTGLTATTDGNGIAQVGSWVLGGSAGVNTMTATVTATGFTGGQHTFADTGYAAGYTITIHQYGPAMPAAAQAAFDSAVAKWQRIIYRPLTLVNLVVPAGTCAPGTPKDSEPTTGLVILAAVDSIDGPGKTLAQAFPCEARASNGLSVFGVMLFDSADVGTLSSTTLRSVILHEMGHVIGFGTLWGPPNPPVQADCIRLQSNPPGTVQDTYFSCPKATAAFDSSGGLNYFGSGQGTPAGNKVPVENCGTAPFVSPTCGAGTVNSHWREVVMFNELMTGFINSSVPNPLSVITVAAQEDLGYTVNYAAADPYSHAFTAPPAGGVAPPVWLGNDVLHRPIYVVDARGAIVRVIPPR